MKTKKPFPCFLLERNKEENSAELTMYGEIVEEIPIDWDTGLPSEGDYIVSGKVISALDDLAASGVKTLTLRLNSLGGDAGVSLLIYNRLRAMARDGVAVSCIVDGVAMSGGSIIMCAADNVSVNPTSLIMIHKCWAFVCGAYNADELREQAKAQDAWDSASIAAYKRKTGLSETVISHMMGETAYLTGIEAVSKGFADSVIEDAEPLDIAASADRSILYVGGRQIKLSRGVSAPDFVPISAKEDVGNMAQKNKGVDITPEETASAAAPQETVTETPEVKAGEPVAAVSADAVSAAVKAERERIRGIDDLAKLYSPEMVYAAKYGDEPCDARELAYRAALDAAKKGDAYLAGISKDYEESGVANVAACSAPEDTDTSKATPEQRLAEARAAVKTIFEGSGK